MTAGEGGTGRIFGAESLRRLFRQLEGTDVDELEIEGNGYRLFLRREPGAITMAPREHGDTRPVADGESVNAPLTGIFYMRPSPEQPAFVGPGDLVEAGQVVALIETMKLFNEVTTDLAGEVTSIGPRDGDLVEAGQPLIWIRPRDEGEQP